MRTKTKISLTGIFIEDPQDKGYTAFFSEVPEAVAEGDNLDETMANLLNILPDVFVTKMQLSNEQKEAQGLISGVVTKSFDFELIH